MATLPIFAVSIAILGTLIVAGFVFTNISFLFLRKLGDGARYCIGWIKTCWVLFFFFSFLQGAAYISFFVNRNSTGSNILSEQFDAIGTLIEPVGLSTLLVTQLEMALGFRYASGLTGELSGIRVPRQVARISYVVAILVSLCRFVGVEYYIVDNNLDSPVTVFKVLQIIVWFVLLAQAVACLVYIFIWCRPSKLTAVRNMLLVMASISVIRHLFEFVVSIAVTAKGEIRALHESFTYLTILTVIFIHGTTFASLIVAWLIAKKNEDGLWGDRIGGLNARPNIEMDPTRPLPPRRI